jgi:putative drug exporter of the RND superfamily
MTSPTSPGGGAHTGVLARLARACALHPKRTIALWVVLLVAAIGSSTAFGGRLVNEFTIPGSETQQATDLLKARFPANAGDSAMVVFTSEKGLSNASAQSTIAAAREAASKVPHVVSVGDPYAGEAGRISNSGTIGFFDVRFDTSASEVELADVEQLEDDVNEAVAGSGITVEYGGDVPNAVAPESGSSEVIGLGAAILVLLLVLGTAVAMSMPILLALTSVGIGIAMLNVAANFTSLNTVTPILAVMLGLGVGIDYALFIVTRFRQSLAEGEGPVDAATTAVATAGRAVVFAGATVAISISGLAIIGLDFVTKLGLGAASTVVISVLAAISLLPAVLSKLGHRVNKWRVPTFVAQDGKPKKHGRPTLVQRWGSVVTRRPKTAAAIALAILFTVSAPAASLQLGSSDAGTDPQHTTTRKAYDLLSEGFGPGINGSLKVAVDQTGDTHAAEKLAKAFSETPGVAAVSAPVVNPDGDAAVLQVFPTTRPQATETSDLVEHLRDDVVPAALAGSTAKAYVGGQTAAYDDIAKHIGERMPMFLGLVMGIIFLILAMAFRSIVIALKAAITTLISGMAALGAIVAIFQWGWLGGLVGLDRTGPIESYMPLILFAILFGLAMDYEVFLVSRIREAFTKGASARDAITEGVSNIGRIIFAAGTIMVVVFWAFVLGDDRTVKEFGVGLGVAILMDAFIVRMILVPAVMNLLGDKAWYMPKWLDRALPHVTIEPPESPEVAEEDDEEEDEELRRAA